MKMPARYGHLLLCRVAAIAASCLAALLPALASAQTADLSISQTVVGAPSLGATYAYHIVISNAGPDTAQDVILDDPGVTGVEFGPIAYDSGGIPGCLHLGVPGGGFVVHCFLGSLAAGASVSITLTAHTTHGAVAGTPILNTASVSSTTSDPASSNNTATTTTALPPSRTFTGPNPAGTGNITASFSGGGSTCSFASTRFIPLVGAFFPPLEPPPGISFAQGLFDFTTSGCTPGSTATFTVTYPADVPLPASYWKHGPTSDDHSAHWYVLPATIDGSTATFSITDGGLGDDDLTANGAIVDQGGPGTGSSAIPQVPTLTEWMMAVLAAAMLLLAAARRVRPRPR
jgi:uncharacterized repeat protein (TIGR01451 family)